MKRTIEGPLLICLGFILCQKPAWSAKKPAALPPSAGGSCDSPYPDPQGNVSFTCRGLTDEQIRLLPSLSTLLNKLLSSGVDGARLEAQTADILNVLQKKNSEAKSETITSLTTSVKPPPASKVPAKEKEIMTYDYRGYKTSSLMGPMLYLGDEGESKQYQKLLALQKEGKWKKLLADATHEIKKVPDWLTPYAFKAVALQHLGKVPEAISSLEYVDQHSAGNSDYDQVRRLLQQLKPANP